MEAKEKCDSNAETDVKTTSSVFNVTEDKPPFGSRFLTADSDVWSKNAWDHVPPPEDQGHKIAASLNRQRAKPVPQQDHSKYNEKPARHWSVQHTASYLRRRSLKKQSRDNFYKMNNANFFRDRKWLHTEFPELVAATQPEAGPMRVVELGCGAGNSAFPLLSNNQNPSLDLRAYDYSNHAIKLVQNNPLYSSPPVGTIHAAVWDVTSPDSLPDGIEPGSVDIVVLVFVLSALHPREWAQAVQNIHKMLKPGGMIVLRDYGRHDLTQLRFKEGRLLGENFYIRGDKTRVYFFDLDDLAYLFTGKPAPTSARVVTTTEQTDADRSIDEDAPSTATATVGNLQAELQTSDHDALTENEATSLNNPQPSTSSSTSSAYIPTSTSSSNLESYNHSEMIATLDHPLFLCEELGVDRRLLLNRKRQIKMYRVWMQGKFKKL